MIKGAPSKPKPAHVSTVNRSADGVWDLGVHRVHFDVNQTSVVAKILEEQYLLGSGHYAAYNMANAIIKLAAKQAAEDTGKLPSAILHDLFCEAEYGEFHGSTVAEDLANKQGTAKGGLKPLLAAAFSLAYVLFFGSSRRRSDG